MHTPMKCASVGVMSTIGIARRISSRLDNVDFSASRPNTVHRIFRHHPACLISQNIHLNRVSYQIAGHSQSPLGSLATTSTLPYLMVFLPFVVMRGKWAEHSVSVRVVLISTLMRTRRDYIISFSPSSLMRIAYGNSKYVIANFGSDPTRARIRIRKNAPEYES
jgi:hypothetical protein